MPDDAQSIDVRAVARLARLRIEPADEATLSAELASVLEHARGLAQLDLGGIEPLSHAADLEAALAADEAGGELPRAALEGIAPEMDGPYLRVPKVLGGQGGA
jgi:aspartyl-tRNA(Asn)/glutamyl-tRNA(Gln) amidotransferase subunit C